MCGGGYQYISRFLYSSVNRHIGCFQTLAIMMPNTWKQRVEWLLPGVGRGETGGEGDVGQGAQLWLWSLNKSRDLVQSLLTIASNIILNLSLIHI